MRRIVANVMTLAEHVRSGLWLHAHEVGAATVAVKAFQMFNSFSPLEF